ncbi:lytic transglycosylase domain-containing protein [uncultured Pseudoalteromonas sp.]|uniref:lytic transglycosylase domain-containing protein n=1 Tax=uncultured Pseudoalteromonas sp. TaxID=114053 RepID=UPI002591FB8E|nr:lytic transglycosylase domain-containing protein [uncultured Pseudoalteromonas sp.]
MGVDIPTEALTYGEPVQQVVVEQCVSKSADKHRFDPTLLLAILDVEGGNKGAVIRNSSNGSHDLGPGQINTIQFKEHWFKKEYPNITWQQLSMDVCLNIEVAGRVLKQRLNELKPNQSVWNAVGNYHSKTDKYKLIYLQKVMKAYRIRTEQEGGGFRMSWTESND